MAVYYYQYVTFDLKKRGVDECSLGARIVRKRVEYWQVCVQVGLLVLYVVLLRLYYNNGYLL